MCQYIEAVMNVSIRKKRSNMIEDCYESLLGEKFFFFNSLGTTKIFKILVFINVVLLINFPGHIELCFYFKYSRNYN